MKKEHPKRHIIPLKSAPRTCPSRIMPGPLNLFVRPLQPLTRPFERAFETRYRKAGAWARWLVAFDAVAVAALATMAAISASVMLLPPPAPLRLSVEASASDIRIGDLVGFSVRYENRSKEALEDASLALVYNDRFQVISVSAEDGNTNIEPLLDDHVIPLGRIAPGGNGTVRVSGYTLTEGDFRFHAQLTGTQDGRRVQSTDYFVLVRVSGSALSLRWTGAPVSGVVERPRTTYVLVAENLGSATIQGLDAFADCLPREECIGLDDFTLGPNERRVVGEYADLSRFGPRARLQYGTGSEVLELAVAGIHPEMVLSGARVVRLQGRRDGNGVDVTTTAGTNGPAIDRGELRLFPLPWSAVDTTGLPADAEYEGIPAGTFELEREQTKDLTFRIPLKPDQLTDDLTIRAVVSGCVSDQCSWSSSERVAVAPPGPTFSAELRYFTAEGEQLGRGPLPPRVEEKTEYWLIAQIATAGRTVADAELTATLAPGVTWAGKASTAIVGAGTPNGVSTLRWRLGEVTAPADAPSTAAFGIAFRPGPGDVGREPTLVESLTLRGRDAETGEAVELRLGPYTTAVQHDTRASEKGTRVEPALE